VSLPSLSPPLLVLASLADGPKHGYAMIQDIERMSGAAKLAVPLEVDVGTGANWDEAH